jgi:hypothetical protein
MGEGYKRANYAIEMQKGLQKIICGISWFREGTNELDILCTVQYKSMFLYELLVLPPAALL